MTAVRLAIAGFGKIANSHHLAAIGATPDVELVGIADPNVSRDGIACFKTLEQLLNDGPEIDAVALCTPPQTRFALAAAALKAGKHVLLEKPPAATVSELLPLLSIATQARRTLFATWHSRFAPAVEPARKILADARIKSVDIVWKEDVRVWHPHQAWIWEPGGLGVFDPGINALSVVTRILPRPFFLTKGDLSFPENSQTPIAAKLEFTDSAGIPIRADFDWRQTGPHTREVHVETDSGRLSLADSGGRLVQDGRTLVDEKRFEYSGIYRRFGELIATGASDFDLSPLAHVADAYMLGRRLVVEPFHD
ncbi:MAG: Gfo/Idh/MocA family oxidoreductase [bacterium]|nr:Gfo/Idh/MocA family oxidoreductase [bacterium]